MALTKRQKILILKKALKLIEGEVEYFLCPAVEAASGIERCDISDEYLAPYGLKRPKGSFGFAWWDSSSRHIRIRVLKNAIKRLQK